MSDKKYFLGHTDARTKGVKNCECYITWRLENGRFSMQAEVWLPGRRDIILGGQCVDEVAELFPDDAKARRMVEVWQRWHLNDMRAGTHEQEALLRAIKDEFPGYPTSYFEWATEALTKAGLNPDPVTGYKYGHAWLKEELPAEVIAEIESW